MLSPSQLIVKPRTTVVSFQPLIILYNQLDSAYKKAAFKLKTGEYTTTPVKTDDGYQVIYMIEHPAKGKKSQHINDLKNQIVQENMNNQNFMRKVVSKRLEEG